MKRMLLGLLILWAGWFCFAYSMSEYFFREEGYSELLIRPGGGRGGYYSRFNDRLFSGLLLLGGTATLAYAGILVLRKNKNTLPDSERSI